MRHIASSFNILLKPLTDITKDTGIFQITAENCINYKEAYDTMATALHMKLTSNDYFKGFLSALTYVQAASNTSNGFKLLYRILEIIHPQLRASKGGIHKTIEPPTYDDITDDSIYTFITRYKNYLLYETLSPENRQYNNQEQTMYVVNALKKDTRFKPGVEYVLAAVLAYQRDRRLNPTIVYPLDLDIDEIAITITERSPDYIVGEQSTKTPSFSNPYATDPVINVARGNSTYSRKYDNNKFKDKNGYSRNNRDTSLTCKACMGVGHCATNPDNICYTLAKAHLCKRFMEQEENQQAVKSNTYRYKKQLKEKANKYRADKRMNNVIKKMVDEGQSQEDIDPIIKLARAINSQTISTYTSDSDSDQDSLNSEDS